MALMDAGAQLSGVSAAAKTTPLEDALHYARANTSMSNLRSNQGACTAPVRKTGLHHRFLHCLPFTAVQQQDYKKCPLYIRVQLATTGRL